MDERFANLSARVEALWKHAVHEWQVGSWMEHGQALTQAVQQEAVQRQQDAVSSLEALRIADVQWIQESKTRGPQRCGAWLTCRT